MKEITQKIRDEAVEKFMPLAIQLQSEGMDPRDILYCLKKYNKNKLMKFYRDGYREKIDFKSIKDDLKNADSKIEKIFFNLLNKNKIPFKFQVEIGSYRVDYLIADCIVFEGDGQQHENQKEYDAKRDTYLERMGFKVMRMRWVLVAQMKDRIIEEIKQLTGNIGGKESHR